MAVADQLPGVGGRLPQDNPSPSVVVSDLHVHYRVYGAGRDTPDEAETELGPFSRLLRRTPSSMGMREIHAVRGVSFVAVRGQSIGVIGRNGSGKSTLLRAVAGLMPISSGRVWLDGTPALLGVNAVLMNNVSGARNIMLGAQALGLSKAQVRERFDDIVEFSGIGDFVDLPMSAYSSGMAARLRFAISTAVVPDILMVDEALATGDADFKERAGERIEEIREQAGTVFMVSHSEKTIRSSCDRALWLERGRLIMDGAAVEVADAYAEATKSSRRRSRSRSGRRSESKDGDTGPPA